jgi:Polyketide cyclase / dehydrase and lipid transport
MHGREPRSDAMWKTEHSVDTTARQDALWRLLADADGWPLWNPGLSSAHLDGPLQRGTTGRTTQSSGHKGHFTVTELRVGAYFVNEAKVPGAVLRFQHRIEEVDEARSRVTLGATIDGPMAPVWGLLIGREIAGYLPTAVHQLAARAEGAAAAGI